MTVYCVMCDDGGGTFLEKIFFKEADANAYKKSMGYYSKQYHVEVWEVE